jgi:hypothetical protein
MYIWFLTISSSLKKLYMNIFCFVFDANPDIFTLIFETLFQYLN